jgi:hypothetical protein
MDTEEGPSKEKKSPPGDKDEKQSFAYDMYSETLWSHTDDALVDALNVFISQFAYTLFQRVMSKLGNNVPRSSSPSSGDYGGLKDYEADPGGVAPNRDNIEAKTMEIMAPNFSIKGDYEVLTELVMCPDPQEAETNHCVIGDTFRQAIQDKMTVIEAMEGGQINSDG